LARRRRALRPAHGREGSGLGRTQPEVTRRGHSWPEVTGPCYTRARSMVPLLVRGREGAMDEESLFAAALQMPDAAQRRAFLDEACAGDVRLRQRVELLLAADLRSRGILEQGPGPAAVLAACVPDTQILCAETVELTPEAGPPAHDV